MKGLDEIIKANEMEMKRYYEKEACKMLGDEMQGFLAEAVVEAIDEYEHQRITIGDLIVRLDKIIADLEKTL